MHPYEELSLLIESVEDDIARPISVIPKDPHRQAVLRSDLSCR